MKNEKDLNLENLTECTKPVEKKGGRRGSPPKNVNEKKDKQEEISKKNTDTNIIENLSTSENISIEEKKVSDIKVGEMVNNVFNYEDYAVNIENFIGKGFLKDSEPDKEANQELYGLLAKNSESIIPMILKTNGLNCKTIPIITSLIIVSRLGVIVRNKIIAIETSGPGTGKSFTLTNIGDFPVISEMLSKSSLTGDKRYNNDTGLLKELILQIDESGNVEISDEMKGILKSIAANEEYSNDGKNFVKVKISLYFTGNPPSEFFNKGEKTLNIPYCIERLKELCRKMVEQFDESFLDRAIVIPGFLLGPLKYNQVLRSANTVTTIPLKKGTPEEIKIFSDKVLNINTFRKTLIEFREKKEFTVSDEIIRDYTSGTDRDVIAINKYYSALKYLLDPTNSFSYERDRALQEIAVIYRNYANGIYKPLNSGYIKILLSDIAKMIIGKEEVEEIGVYENRILIKPENENKFYKIALTDKGQEENRKEYNLYNSVSDNVKEILPKIYSIDYGDNVLVQEYFSPFSDSKGLSIEEDYKYKKLLDENRKLKRKLKLFEEKTNVIFKEIVKQLNYFSQSVTLGRTDSFFDETIIPLIDKEDNMEDIKVTVMEILESHSIILKVDELKPYDFCYDDTVKLINFANISIARE